MEIIATTIGGVFISATNNEVKEIMNAVNGAKPDVLIPGMKIPAIDYASTIKKIQTLQEDYHFKELCKERIKFSASLEALISTVVNASNITTD